MTPLIEAWAAIGGLGGAGALIASVAGLVHARRASVQMQPNHGSSMRDQTTRIERTLEDVSGTMHEVSTRLARLEATADAHSELISSLGHQIGELRDDARQTHAEHARRIDRLEQLLED